MDLRTLGVGFVGVLLAGTMTFVILTNDERLGSSPDRGPGGAPAAAASQGGSSQPGHTDSPHAAGDQAAEHTLTGDHPGSGVGTPGDGHTGSTGHTGSAAATHDDTGHEEHAGPASGGAHPADDHPPGGGPHDAADPPEGHHSPAPGGQPTPPAGSDSGVTPEQAAAAATLLADTKSGLQQWRDEDKVVAAGFRTIGDAFTGYEHLVNWNWIDDDIVLDPDHPESLVYRVTPQGRVLEAAMYMLPFGTADQDIPDIGGTLTQWHIHNNLCFTPAQIVDGYPQRRVIGLTDAGGNCHGSEKLPISPMLHVWIVDHPCGPFASLEGVGGGQAVDEPQDPNADPACQHSTH